MTYKLDNSGYKSPRKKCVQLIPFLSVKSFVVPFCHTSYRVKPIQTTIAMRKLFCHFGLVILMTNCTHYYYVPPAQNVPLFKEQGELRVNASAGAGDESRSTDIQAAYAITNKFALMSNFMTARGGEVNSITDDWAKGNYIDGAFGYYQTVRTHGVFEVYGGFGGSSQFHYYGDGSTSELGFTRAFIQPSIGLRSKYVEIAFTSGFSNVNFHRVEMDSLTPAFDSFSINGLMENNNFILFEPALTLRLGWKHFKVQGQVNTSQNLSNATAPFENLKFSAGVSILFPCLKSGSRRIEPKANENSGSP